MFVGGLVITILWRWVVIEGGTPPQVCQMGRAEVVYKLPTLLNCTGREYEEWRVKVEKRNIKEYQSKAAGMIVVKRQCVAEESFWGVRTQDKSISYVTLNREVAERLIEQNSCINVKGEVSLEMGKADYTCKWGWMKKITTEEISCKHFQGSVYAKHGGVARTDLTGFRGCDYSKGYCRALDGMYLKWEVMPEVEADFVEVGKYEALKINNHLLIEELGQVFEVGLTENVTRWIDREFRLTKIEEVQGIVPNITANSDGIDALREEINRRIQFLTELIKSPRAQASYLCEVWNKLRTLERMMARVDPTTYIRLKTNNSLVTGKYAGDYILAYPCVEVENLKWVKEEVGVKCHDGLAVEFTLEGSDAQHKGFLLPKYNRIELRGVQVDCHRREPEITEVNGEIQWHAAFSEEVHKVNLSDVVDLTYNLDKGIGMIDFLQTDWVYDSEDLRDAEIDRLVREGDGMSMDNENPSSDKNDKVQSLWNFLGIWNGEITTVFYAMFVWVERVIVVVIFWKVFRCDKSSCLQNRRFAGLSWRRARENASVEEEVELEENNLERW